VARRRGWGGNPPADDAEASARIVTAAVALIERTGAEITLADVAADLGVIRQTIYRYFPTAQALMGAAAIRAADALIAQLAERVTGVTDPAAALVEVCASAIEMVPDSPQMALLLTGPDAAAYSTAAIHAVPFGRRMVDCMDVDWAGLGYTEADLDDLVEYMLRIVTSFFLDPGPPRSPAQLRRFLARWAGPGLDRNLGHPDLPSSDG